MKNLFKYAFLIVLLLCMISCSKDHNDDFQKDDNQESTFILNDDVIIFNESIYEFITFAKDGCLKLSSEIPSESIPEKGQIICAGISDNTPYGYIGRIRSIREEGNEYVFETESVQLSEVFEELHVNLNMDITESLVSAEDKENNVYASEIVSDDIWDTLSEEYSDSLSFLPTKADIDFEIPASTMSLPIINDSFDGNLYVKFGMTFNMDISAGLNINKFDISIYEMAGIEGEWTLGLSTGGELKLSDLSYKFRPIPIPGTPIVVIPEAYSSLTMHVGSSTELVTSFKYRIANEKHYFHFDGTNMTFGNSQENPKEKDNYFRFKSIDCNSSITLSPVVGLKCSFWNENVLAVGSELTSDLMYNFKSAVSMKDEKLLVTNPQIIINPKMGISLYAESFLFKILPGSDDGRYSWGKSIEGKPVIIKTLPSFTNITTNHTDGAISVTSDIVASSLLRYEEVGFALFDKGSELPIEHKRYYRDIDTRSKFSEISFTKPDKTKSYILKPYVLSDGNYYYGGISKKRIKSFSVDGATGYICYDELNRIISYKQDSGASISIIYNEDDNAIISYDGVDTNVSFSDNKIVKIGDTNIQYDSDGFIYRCYDQNEEITYSTKGGNILNWQCWFYSTDTSIQSSYQYTDFDNKFNFDVWSDEELFIPTYYIFFSGPVTNKLPASKNSIYGNSEYSYELDNAGYVTKAVSESNGNIVVYTFQYEEYYE